MSDILTKYEVLIEQHLRSILDIETHDPANYKCLPKLVQTNNAFSSIIKGLFEATTISHDEVHASV